MSDALKPSLHGRDHRVGGADPIPGLGGLTFCYLGPATPKNCPLNTRTPINGDNTSFYTNDASVFSLQSVVVGGTTYYGPSIDANGHYLVMAFMDDNSTPSAGTAYNVVLHGNSGTVSSFFLGPTGHVAIAGETGDSARLLWGQMQTVGDFGASPPTGAITFDVVNGSTGGAFTASISVMIVRFDADTTELL